jgi:hypothetical protein
MSNGDQSNSGSGYERSLTDETLADKRARMMLIMENASRPSDDPKTTSINRSICKRLLKELDAVDAEIASGQQMAGQQSSSDQVEQIHDESGNMDGNDQGNRGGGDDMQVDEEEGGDDETLASLDSNGERHRNSSHRSRRKKQPADSYDPATFDVEDDIDVDNDDRQKRRFRKAVQSGVRKQLARRQESQQLVMPSTPGMAQVVSAEAGRNIFVRTSEVLPRLESLTADAVSTFFDSWGASARDPTLRNGRFTQAVLTKLNRLVRAVPALASWQTLSDEQLRLHILVALKQSSAKSDAKGAPNGAELKHQLGGITLTWDGMASDPTLELGVQFEEIFRSGGQAEWDEYDGPKRREVLKHVCNTCIKPKIKNDAKHPQKKLAADLLTAIEGRKVIPDDDSPTEKGVDKADNIVDYIFDFSWDVVEKVTYLASMFKVSSHEFVRDGQQQQGARSLENGESSGAGNRQPRITAGFGKCHWCGRNNSHAAVNCNMKTHSDANSNPQMRWVDTVPGIWWFNKLKSLGKVKDSKDCYLPYKKRDFTVWTAPGSSNSSSNNGGTDGNASSSAASKPGYQTNGGPRLRR